MKNTRIEYLDLAVYYRRNRQEMSYVEKKEILERIVSLQSLNGRNSLSWKRLLYKAYSKLDLYEENMKLISSVYNLSKHPKDRFTLLQLLLLNNKISVREMKEEVMEFLADSAHDLFDRMRAAILLFRSDGISPLDKAELEALYRFYEKEVFPERISLPLRLFSEISFRYAIRIFKYSPEKEKWATIVLELLESLLESSGQEDLLIMLYEAFSHHNNVRTSSKFTTRLIDIYKRDQNRVGYLISLVNECINAYQQGNLDNFQKLMDLIGEETINRLDYSETLLGIQLNFSLEWEKWELFDELYEKLLSANLTLALRQSFQVSYQYANFLRAEEGPVTGEDFDQTKENKLFLKALEQIKQGNQEEGITYFKKCIEASRYKMVTGWCYRELIPLVIDLCMEEAKALLDEFENFIQAYGFDAFWPDFYRLLSSLHSKMGDKLEAIMNAKRAINSYHVMGKEKWKNVMQEHLNQLLLPEYLPAHYASEDHWERKLLEDRQSYLELSLDYLLIAKFVEYVTEGQELSDTVERLSTIIFDYFPINKLAATYQLNMEIGMLEFYSSGRNYSEKDIDGFRSYFFELYEQNNNSLSLELITANDLSQEQLKQIRQLFAYIKPHIANNIYFMEMIRDSLTGFLLRRYFISQLRTEYDLARQFNLDLSVIMIDIDNFRSVNEFGHQEGDKVLREVAGLISNCLGKKDLPCRYGGEELLIILPKTDGELALAKAEKIKSEIENGFLDRPYKVTASIGVASSLLCKPANAEELIYMADKAEIMAKNTGKNKVVAAWELEM